MTAADLTKREFALQAQAMTQGRTFNADEAVAPFVRLPGTPLPMRVLDVACGPGIVTAAVASAGPNVVAFDLTDEMLAAARRRCEAATLANVEFREGLLEDVPVPDSWADAVISNGVINLCADKLQVFAEIRRILRPGGVLRFADIATGKPVPDSAKSNIDLWTD